MDSASEGSAPQTVAPHSESHPATAQPAIAAQPSSPLPFEQLPGRPERIVLTGFMGSGKSTIGRLLARHLRWRFVDIDTVIESAEGQSISQIFATRGEPWFRELEHRTIASQASGQNLVLALGGGAIEDPRTLQLLLQTPGTRLIHLEVSLETVLLRCRGSEATRPVLADSANLHHRYQRRLPLYRQSHLTIAVDHLRPHAILDAILAQVRNAPQS